MTLPPRQPNQTERDLAVIVGGNFTPDALGPEHGRIVQRLRAAPAAYIDAFERLYLARGANAQVLARLRPEAFLAQVQSVAPDRVRTIAERLVRHYDSALAVADHAAASETDLLEALPPGETTRFVSRLNRRRQTLRTMLGTAGGTRRP